MNSDNEITQRLVRAKALAFSAGQIICSARENKAFTEDHKLHNELVTSTDRDVDQFLISELSKDFPNDQFLTEESYQPSDLNQIDFDKETWVIDPIDGTVNFAYGHPQVAVSIALVIDHQVVFGIVHCPFLNETFHAIKNQGAFLNDEPIYCLPCDQLKDAIIASGLPYDKSLIPSLLTNFNNVMLQSRDIRRNGSAAIDLCWVACGRIQAYFETVQPWDMAAGTLIAVEAGAKFNHYGKTKPTPNLIPDLQSKNMVTCSPGIENELLDLLQ